MAELQTIGQDFNKGFIIKSYYTDELTLMDKTEKNLFQVLYIDEGSVIVGDTDAEKTLFTPVLLCLNYTETQKKIHITNGKGFSLFFKPEVINNGLIGSEYSDGKVQNPEYLTTEQLLLYPFEQSRNDNPISLSVNGSIRNRILRMADNIKTQFYKQPDEYWPCRGRSFMLEMLMLLQSMYKMQTETTLEIKSTDNTITPALRQIHTEYCNCEFNVNSITTKAGLGKLFFLHAFKKVTGTGPKKYLMQLRCTVAENLLKNTMLSAEEIARRCGYASEAVFNESFFKIHKTTPLAWRSKFPNPYG